MLPAVAECIVSAGISNQSQIAERIAGSPNLDSHLSALWGSGEVSAMVCGTSGAGFWGKQLAVCLADHSIVKP